MNKSVIKREAMSNFYQKCFGHNFLGLKRMKFTCCLLLPFYIKHVQKNCLFPVFFELNNFLGDVQYFFIIDIYRWTIKLVFVT